VLATEATLALSSDSASRARIAYDYQLLDHAGLRPAYEELHRLTRAVATSKPVALPDVGALLSTDATNLADHVHSSPTGSAAMARLLTDFLAPLLPLDSGGAR